jgi:hypothetical protein
MVFSANFCQMVLLVTFAHSIAAANETSTTPSPAVTPTATPTAATTSIPPVDPSSEQIADDKHISGPGPAPKEMPQLPHAFSVVVEVNRVNTRESFNVHQYYDFENKRVRTDVHDNGMMASTISDFGTKMRYMLINDLSSKDFFPRNECSEGHQMHQRINGHQNWL